MVNQEGHPLECLLKWIYTLRLSFSAPQATNTIFRKLVKLRKITLLTNKIFFFQLIKTEIRWKSFYFLQLRTTIQVNLTWEELLLTFQRNCPTPLLDADYALKMFWCFLNSYNMYSLISIRQNFNFNMSAMIWHDIVFWFLKIYPLLTVLAWLGT